MRTVDESIREMVERAIELARRHAVWWRLVNAQDFAKYEAVVSNHEDFFATVSHALFESFVGITYQLYESRKDTISLPSMIDSLQAINPTLAERLRILVADHRPLFSKAFAIRCGVYAHRSKTRPPEDIFARAGLSIPEMETIVSVTKEVVAELVAAAGVDSSEEIIEEINRRAQYSKEDTRLIMETLRKHAL